MSHEHYLRTEQWVPRPLDEVFDFFAQARNLDRITPPALRFEILTSGELEMEAGLLIDYRLRLHGLPLRWRSRISDWEPPHRFVDEQVLGPYSRWVHEHRFAAGEGGTWVRDRVRFRSPLDLIAHPLLVRKDVLDIFAYRGRALEEIMGAEPQKLWLDGVPSALARMVHPGPLV
jgi:ligand-binding SRPBCC domain-containing protein